MQNDELADQIKEVVFVLDVIIGTLEIGGVSNHEEALLARAKFLLGRISINSKADE